MSHPNKDLEIESNYFTGTEKYYKHLIGNFLYNDGVKYLAETAKCFWLLDVVGSYQLTKKVRNIPFQLWELTVRKDNTAVATMKEDTDAPFIIKQEIPFTDFPLEHIRLYFVDDVLMLPS